MSLLAATSSSTGHSVSHSVGRSLSRSVFHRSPPLFSGRSFRPRRLKFGMEVKCVCLCERSWSSSWPFAVSMGVAYCKKVHNCRMDSLTHTRFSVKVGHEPKDS